MGPLSSSKCQPLSRNVHKCQLLANDGGPCHRQSASFCPETLTSASFWPFFEPSARFCPKECQKTYVPPHIPGRTHGAPWLQPRRPNIPNQAVSSKICPPQDLPLTPPSRSDPDLERVSLDTTGDQDSSTYCTRELASFMYGEVHATAEPNNPADTR